MNRGQWIGVFAGHVWMLSQTNDSILYKSFCMEHSSSHQFATAGCNEKSVSESHVDDSVKCSDHSRLLHDYFQLSVNLQEMYEDWSQRGYCI